MIKEDLQSLTKTKRILRIGNVAKYLTPLEYDILCRRFGIDGHLPATYIKISKIYKRYKAKKYKEWQVSARTIARIEEVALAKVRDYMEALRNK